jgi:hypothetical protein
LLLLEILPVSAQVMHPFIGFLTERNLEAGRDELVDFLEKNAPPGLARILPMHPEEFRSNRFAGFGIASLGGYHAAKPRLIQDLLDRNVKSNPDWLRLLNVVYIVQYGELGNPPPFLRLVFRRPAFLTNGPTGQDTVYQCVYANLAALPRATLVDAYAVVQPPRAIVDSVSTAARDMAAFTYLEQDPHLKLGPVSGGRIRIESYHLNDVTIDVETPGPALLRLADAWYPDWTARVDGRPTPVLKADYLLRAVHVPAGRHQVVFRFESPAVGRGLIVSLLSLVVVLAGFAAWWWMRRRGPAAAGQAQRPVAGEEAA